VGGHGGGQRHVAGMSKDCYDGNFSETADEACSSEAASESVSILLRMAMDCCPGEWDEEVTSQLSRKGGGGGGIVRDQAKEFQRVEVCAAVAFAAGKCAGAQYQVDSSSHVRLLFCSE
jgi:hypothetical protein